MLGKNCSRALFPSFFLGRVAGDARGDAGDAGGVAGGGAWKKNCPDYSFVPSFFWGGLLLGEMLVMLGVLLALGPHRCLEKNVVGPNVSRLQFFHHFFRGVLLAISG